MKQWQLENGFGPANLKLREAPSPEPGSGEVRVRLTAASLNFRDLMVIGGLYGGEQPLPLVPLSDAAGEVEAVGPGVRSCRPGDRVTACFHQGWPGGAATRERLSHALGAGRTSGVAASHRIFREDGLVPTPAYLDDRQAAALPCAAVTAWSALVQDCRAEPGETVLVQGTGGVALFALQFAKAMGMAVAALSSTEEKLAHLKSLGADHVVNYKATPDWAKAVREATGGRGVDHVIEVGGAGTLEQSLKAIRIGGRIAVIGVLSGPKPELSLPLLFMQHAQLQGITVGSRDAHLAMNRFVALHKLQPVLDKRRFGFDALPDALEHMRARRHIGKICIDYGS